MFRCTLQLRCTPGQSLAELGARHPGAALRLEPTPEGLPPPACDALIEARVDEHSGLWGFVQEHEGTAGNMMFSHEHPAIIDGPKTGIRFTSFLKRNAALGFDEFCRHHLDPHAGMFAAQPAVRRHVRRYVIAHRLPDSDGEFDGIVDFWFDDVAAIYALFADTQYQKVMQPDEAKLLDLPACKVILTQA